MKMIALVGAAIAALFFGMAVAHAAVPVDLLSAAQHIGSLDPMLACALVPMANQSHALLTPRARGIAAARADGGNAAAMLEELGTTFAAFKETHAEELKNLKKGFDDVVTKEKMDRINADMDKVTKAIDEVNAVIAALKTGGGSNDNEPFAKEHSTAFARYFRKGDIGNLGELQVKAALTTQSDPDGGYLVPTEVSKTIDRILGTVSVMRQLATVMPIGTSEYKKLVNVGGATAGWVGEEEARPETATPTLKELIFTVMEIYANPATTRTMLDDGIIDIGAWLADEVNIAFSEQEGAAFISGNGVKRPRGLLSYDTVENSTWAWGKLGFVATGAAAGFAPTNPADAFIDLFYALKEGYRNNATWLASDGVMKDIRKLKDADDNYLWAMPDGVGKPATLLQKPIRTDDYMNKLGANTFPVAFGDFQRGYLIVDRQGVRVLRDELTKKPYVQFYTTKRVGGGVANFEAIKLLKCTTS